MRRCTFILTFALTQSLFVSIVSRPAEAQGVLGLWYQLAEKVDTRQLECDREQLASDLKRGDVARVNRDLARIRHDEMWLAIDRRGFPWSTTTIGPAVVATPPAEVSIVIVNPEQTRVAVSYVVDGVVYKTPSGGRQQLVLAPSSQITYDRGGNFGVQRYALSTGVYEFRASEKGWALVKLRPGR